jgi:hypothetical protein
VVFVRFFEKRIEEKSLTPFEMTVMLSLSFRAQREIFPRFFSLSSERKLMNDFVVKFLFASCGSETLTIHPS